MAPASLLFLLFIILCHGLNNAIMQLNSKIMLILCSGVKHEKLKKLSLYIIISSLTAFKYISEIRDKEDRFVSLKGKTDQIEVTLLNIYGLPASEESFFFITLGTCRKC